MAVINVSGGGTSKLLIIGAIIAIIGLIYFIKKNPNFLKNLMGGGGKVGAVVGETTVQGPNVYPVVGPITESTGEESRTRCNTAGCGEGSGNNSNRDNVGFPCYKCNRETTWFFVPGTASGEPCHDL